jgi:hypothetical protein
MIKELCLFLSFTEFLPQSREDQARKGTTASKEADFEV